MKSTRGHLGHRTPVIGVTRARDTGEPEKAAPSAPQWSAGAVPPSLAALFVAPEPELRARLRSLRMAARLRDPGAFPRAVEPIEAAPAPPSHLRHRKGRRH